MNDFTKKQEQRKLIRQRFAQVILVGLIWTAVLFLSSGSLSWPNAWVYAGTYIVMLLINAGLMYARNPELIAERARQGEGAKAWDRLLAGMMSFYGPLLVLLTAGLNERWDWQPRPTLPVQVAGAFILIFGYAGWGWAMNSNPFFSGLVRIQKERQHRTVTTGPYRFVRHPAYAAYFWMIFGMPFMLDSLWALIPAGITNAIILIRTALEDKTLLAELDGYRNYAAEVPWRLFPGIW